MNLIYRCSQVCRESPFGQKCRHLDGKEITKENRVSLQPPMYKDCACALESKESRTPHGLTRGILNMCKVCNVASDECKCSTHPHAKHQYCPCCGVVFYTDAKTCQSADPHLTELLEMPK